MNDDLYSIIMEGAFADKAEFDDFVKQSTPEEIYELVKDGAFSSFEEFKQFFFKDGQVDGNVEDVKKKDEGMVSPSEDGSLDSSETESLAQQKQFLEGTMQQSPVESTDTFKPQSAEALAVEEEVVEEPQIVSPELQEARLGPTDEEKRKSELLADVSQFKAQSKERLEERQAKVTEGLEREDILLSEDFNNAINATTPETINLPQKDAVK